MLFEPVLIEIAAIALALLLVVEWRILASSAGLISGLERAVWVVIIPLGLCLPLPFFLLRIRRRRAAVWEPDDEREETAPEPLLLPRPLDCSDATAEPPAGCRSCCGEAER